LGTLPLNYTIPPCIAEVGVLLDPAFGAETVCEEFGVVAVPGAFTVSLIFGEVALPAVPTVGVLIDTAPID
jgi:hypothetical protein